MKLKKIQRKLYAYAAIIGIFGVTTVYSMEETEVQKAFQEKGVQKAFQEINRCVQSSFEHANNHLGQQDFVKAAQKFSELASQANELESICLIRGLLLKNEEGEQENQLAIRGQENFKSFSIENIVVEESDPPFRCVLSIDGGGMRGLIPALYLKWIEKASGMKAVNLLDGFCGTSVGGIIALGLNYSENGVDPKYPASEFVNLFKNRGEEIFPKYNGYFPWAHSISSFIGEKLFYSRYSPVPLENLLNEYFPNKPLRESLKPFFITTIDTTVGTSYGEPFIFSSEAAKEKNEEDYYYVDIGRATSAATTYFPAASIKNVNGRVGKNFIDAGLVLNNPSKIAYDQIKKLYPDDKILLISFGTGRSRNTAGIPIDQGALRSVKSLISHSMQMCSDNTHNEVSQRLLDDGNAYVRVDVILDQEIDLDSTDPVHLSLFEKLANENKKEIQKIAGFLKENSQKR